MATPSDIASEANNTDYYELLDVPATASEAELRRAYRKTSLKYHPDKVGNAPEAAAKFQLLQIALDILSDPATRATYDQAREAKQRRVAENAQLEGRRRKMKEDLERRENGAFNPVASSGTKRSWGGKEESAEAKMERDVRRIAEENRRRREAMSQGRQRDEDEVVRIAEENERRTEAMAQEVHHEEEPETDSIDRSVKVRWVKDAKGGGDIDPARLSQMCERFGEVETILLLKDKKVRLKQEPGAASQEKKSVVGTGVVIFATIAEAKKAVESRLWTGIESVSWARDKQEKSQTDGSNGHRGER